MSSARCYTPTLSFPPSCFCFLSKLAAAISERDFEYQNALLPESFYNTWFHVAFPSMSHTYCTFCTKDQILAVKKVQLSQLHTHTHFCVNARPFHPHPKKGQNQKFG